MQHDLHVTTSRFSEPLIDEQQHGKQQSSAIQNEQYQQLNINYCQEDYCMASEAQKLADYENNTRCTKAGTETAQEFNQFTELTTIAANQVNHNAISEELFEIFNHNQILARIEVNTTEHYMQQQEQDNELREENSELLHHNDSFTELQIHSADQAVSAQGVDDEISEEDIETFKRNDSLEEAFSSSQEGESQHVPKIDMEFQTDDDAYKFYNQYAMIVGFSVVKCGNYHSRQKETMGLVTRVTFKCNKNGKPAGEQQSCEHQGVSGTGVQISRISNNRKKYPLLIDEAQPIPAARRKNTKVIDKTNCQAQMVISLVKGIWKVTRLNLDHNHKLLNPELS